MNNTAEALVKVGDDLLGVLDEVFDGDTSRRLSEQDVMEVLAAAARITRAGEALLVAAAAQVCDRSDGRLSGDRMTTRYGCRTTAELVQRVTRASKQRAVDVVKAARAVVQPTSITSGEVLPAALPGMRAALGAAEVGVDGVVAVAGPLASHCAGTAAILAADEEISACARGEGADAAPPACADELRALATVWAMYLDQDGPEPDDARAIRKRGLTIGPTRDGLHPIRGHVLPEVAAQLQRAFDAVLNPKLAGPPAPSAPRFRALESQDDDRETVDPDDRDAPFVGSADDRTRAQKQHDALAMILNTVTASGALPTLGGAAPTLMVSVREEDLATGRGFAHLAGTDQPLPISFARHIACSGAVQRVVFDTHGRIVQLGTPERIFTHHQRRAIAVRDGGCIIPGCHVPADWCEIHHVTEHARGGPTHTDNGVLLCWFHHRTLDTSGWRIRMNHGVPEVRGPYWWDAHLKWRPVTTSKVRLRERHLSRS
jgi:hypothetical protein